MRVSALCLVVGVACSLCGAARTSPEAKTAAPEVLAEEESPASLQSSDAPGQIAPAEEPHAEAVVERRPGEAEVVQPGIVPNRPAAEIAFTPEFKEELYKALGAYEKMRDSASAQEKAPASEASPRARGSLPSSILRGTVALCIVLALVLIAYSLLRRYGRHSPLFAGAHLGTILGRLYLTPRASLHFVRAGGRVLVLGVTPGNISLVADMDGMAFERAAERSGGSGGEHAMQDFLSHLKASTEAMDAQDGAATEDAELSSLRGEIQRLQESLKGALREVER